MALSKSFLNAAKKSVFNSSEWTPVGEAYPLKDIWGVMYPGQYEKIAGDTAEVTLTTFEDGGESLRITIPFKDGGSMDLKLSGKSELEEGDVVSIASITGQELKKLGQENIVRYDAELADEK